MTAVIPDYSSANALSNRLIRPPFEIARGDVVESCRFEVGPESRLEVSVVGEVLRSVEQIAGTVLRET